MKKLELKDIAGYLPFELNFQVYEEGKLYQGEFIGYDNHGNFSVSCGMCCAHGRLEDEDIKPILRPMSDLTKEITHRGEKFVPMDRIQAISRFFEFDDCGLLFMWNGCTQLEWLQVFELLAEWMFDYRGLIPAKLAIDVNTLPENPYEK